MDNIENKEARDALRQINENLMKVQQELSDYMSTYCGPEAKMVMFIEDKKTNPSRGQSEEIEPEFVKMKFLDPQ